MPCFANRSPGPAQTPLSPGRDDLSLRTAGPSTPRPHTGSPSPPQSTDVRVHATPQTPPASDVATTGPRAPLHVGPCRSEDSGRAQGARGFRSRRISDTAWGPPHSLPTSTCSTSRRALPLPPGYLSHPPRPSSLPLLSSPLLSPPRHLAPNPHNSASSLLSPPFGSELSRPQLLLVIVTPTLRCAPRPLLRLREPAREFNSFFIFF